MTDSNGASMTLTVTDGSTVLKIGEMTIATRGEADKLSAQIKELSLLLPVRLYPSKAKVKPKSNNRPAPRPSLARAASEGAATEAARD